MNESHRKSKTSVLIVGAGPTGLILAFWLKKKGIDLRIIDKSSAPGETSRALAVQARTLELYRQLGIDQEIIAQGITTRQIILRRLGRIVAKAQLGAMGEGMSPFPYLLFCSQDLHEAALCAELKKLGVTVERQVELQDFSQNKQNVVATVKTSAGFETIEADYMVGCDGAHSKVRHGLGLDFPGGTYSQVFYVADVQASGEAADAGLQISLSKKDFCIIMPIKLINSVRLTGVVPPENENKKEITFFDVESSVKRNTGLNVTKVNWFSTYHVHHRVVQHFRQDRVFLAGDAAHIHSPAGGQGMNTGIGDAINLAWKLAEVIHHRASEKILESYEPERLAFAKKLVATTDTAFRFIASRSFFGSIFRAYVLPRLFSLLVLFRPFLTLAFRTISQIRIKYRESILSQGIAGEVYAGDRLPWVQQQQGDNFESLKSLDWQLHIYGKASPEIQTCAQELGLALHRFPWSTEAGAKGLKENALYLIRPDGYVGFASDVQNKESLSEYVHAWKIKQPQ